MAQDHTESQIPSRLMARVEVAVAVLFVCGAAGLAIFMPRLIGSGGIETARDFLTLTPAFFPQLAMAMLAVVSSRYALEAWRIQAISTGSHSPEELVRLKRAGFMFLVAIFYAAFITWMGFILSTMLVAGIVSYFMGLRKPLSFLPTVVVAPILIRFVFERLLFIALPRSEIEFVAGIEDAVIGLLVTVFL